LGKDHTLMCLSFAQVINCYWSSSQWI
jgi:hypothetical protein